MGRNGVELRIGITGDTHFVEEDRDTVVARQDDFFTAVRKLERTRHLDFLVHTGDITDNSSLEVMRQFSERAGNINLEILAVLGNHDLRNGETNLLRENIQSSGKVHLIDDEPYIFTKGGKKTLIVGLMGISGGFGTSVVGYSRMDPSYRIAEEEEIDRALGILKNHSDASVLIVVSHYPLVVKAKNGKREHPTNCPSDLGKVFVDSNIPQKLFLHGHFHENTVSHKIGDYDNLNGAIPQISPSGEIFRLKSLKT